jgi:hypothetical protein
MTKSTGFVYSLSHKTRTDTPIYIGSTSCLKTRFDSHRYACNNKKQIKYNYYVYEFIRDYGGFDNWKINKLIECVYENKDELIKIERMYIDKYLAEDKKLLNKVIPQRTSEEYATYYKPKQTISSMLSRMRNRESQNQKRKEYYHKNKELIKKKNTEYYHKNKNTLDTSRQTKFVCICGNTISRKSRPIHLKTVKHHTDLLANLNETLTKFNN